MHFCSLKALHTLGSATLADGGFKVNHLHKPWHWTDPPQVLNATPSDLLDARSSAMFHRLPSHVPSIQRSCMGLPWALSVTRNMNGPPKSL